MNKSLEDHFSDYRGASGAAPNPARRAAMVLNMGPSIRRRTACCASMLELKAKPSVLPRPTSDSCTPASRKQCEALTWAKALTLTDRVRLPGESFEQPGLLPDGRELLQIEIPERAQWLRVMMTEFSRLNSHLVWLGTHCPRYRRDEHLLLLLPRTRGDLRILEMFSGQRMMTSYIRIGESVAARTAGGAGKSEMGRNSSADSVQG